MTKSIKIISILVVVLLCCCMNEATKLKLIKAKSNEKTILFPEPFVVLRNSDNKFDPGGASQISNWIKSETRSELERQLQTIEIPIQNDTEYYGYGKMLSKLMSRCEHKGIGDTLILGKTLENIINKYPNDLCLFVLNYGYSRSSTNKSSQIAASVTTGIAIGLLTGFVFVPGFDITSNTIYVAVYSKSKQAILYFDHDEDKDDPAVKKNTIEEISTLLKDFIEAGQQTNKTH